jgi:Domain of unknown function (DUF4386)
VTERAVVASPQVYARVGGWLYAVIFVMAGLSMNLESKLIVSDDPAATAHHIVASLSQWRIATASELVMFSCDIALALIFYILLRPVNANLALLAALFRFAEATIGSINVIWHAAPVFLLGSTGYLKAVEPQTLQTLAYVSLRLYDYGFAIALIPFGLSCFLLGYLIFASTYLPRTLGVLMMIAGACYVINSFALVAAPGIASATFIAMFAFGFPAELGLCLWLIIMGVNVQKWNRIVMASYK